LISGASSSANDSGWELTLANTSPVYLQAQVFRQHLSPVCQTHPGLRSQWLRASDGGIVFKFSCAGRYPGPAESTREVPLPEDVPPGGRLKVRVPVDRLPASWAGRTLEIEPSFSGLGQAEAPAETADIKLSITGQPTAIVRSSPSGEVGNR
jgi:hypothetical protein